MSDVVVRRARPGDAGALVALTHDVGSEPEGWLLATSEWRSVGAERRYIRSTRRSPNAAVFLAKDGEEVVGRLSIARDAHPASFHVASLGLIVAKSHRRRGIGRALLEQAVAWARDVGVSKLELYVFPHNQPAIALYESFGFAREGYRRNHYRRAGELMDAVVMAYELPPTLS